MKLLPLIMIFAAMPIIGFGQTTVSGNILNERGEKVEYVSIGFNRDSVGKNGFQLEETKVGAVVKGGKTMDLRVFILTR